MFKINFSLFLLLSVASLYAQAPFVYTLEGKWQLENKSVYEQWKRAGAVLQGLSYKVTGGDTVVLEKMTIHKKDAVIFFTSDVEENPSAVDFKITSMTDTSFVAENHSHDFPKIIKYTIARKGNVIFLQASIEGDGKTIYFSFKRIE